MHGPCDPPVIELGETRMSTISFFPPDRATSTYYGFALGHVFAIRDPDEVLYEHLGHDDRIMEARPIATPALRQVFTRAQFGELVAAGKVDPRVAQNSVARRRIAALNPDIASARDLPEDEREPLVFYARLCRRIEEMYDAGETSKTDVALRRAIRRAMAELYLGADENDDREIAERTKGSKSRGRKTMRFAAVPAVRKLKARKTLSSFDVPSPSTVREWISKLREHDWDELAIRDGRKGRAGNRSPKLDHPLSISIMSGWVRAYLDRSRPTVSTLYKLMKGTADLDAVNRTRDVMGHDPHSFHLPTFAGENEKRALADLPALPIPSLSTFQRAIRKLPKFEICVARHGSYEARRRFKIAGRRTAALAAGERVAIDCWKIQQMLRRMPHQNFVGMTDEQIAKVTALRLTVCIAICEATKVPLGMRLSVNADAETSLRTLEMVCRDKTAMAREAGCQSSWHQTCTPETVPTDSGSEFVEKDFRWAVRDIGAANEVGPGGHPDARPVMERFFGTLDLQFCQFFQGRTFSGVADKGDYKPKAFANVVVETLRVALVRFLVDAYMNTPHGGLGGQTPADAWEERTRRYGVMPPPHADLLRSVFGFADTRRIQNRGIRFLGLTYGSEDLMRLRLKVGQADVRIRVDLNDLGAISVSEDRLGSAWFAVPCDIDMSGVSATEWLSTAADLRRRHADASRLRERVVLAALRDIRLLGLQSALEAGLGPSTMSHADLLKEETVVFRDFGIVTADSRENTLQGLDAGVGAKTAEDEAGGASVAASDPMPAPDGVEPSAPTRRRGRLGNRFLSEE